MSRINDVVQRAISDAAFRSQLRSDPAKALRGFSLSPEETRALTSGDSARLVALGVDQRMSKVFTAGPDASTHSMVSTAQSDTSPAVHSALTSTGGAAADVNISDPYQGEFITVPETADAHAALQPSLSRTGGEDLLVGVGDESTSAFIAPVRDATDSLPVLGDTSNAAIVSPAPLDADAVPDFHSAGETHYGGDATDPGTPDANEITP